MLLLLTFHFYWFYEEWTLGNFFRCEYIANICFKHWVTITTRKINNFLTKKEKKNCSLLWDVSLMLSVAFFNTVYHQLTRVTNLEFIFTSSSAEIPRRR